ncbi:anhydro-N-acetylmuramic acid kinase [Methylocapsa palsarum]|uniref:Anhydro-N-acetylmuramic acid kinase n=1 Tax=Methylocapsa palsarum TaxID=1612308 RepID=A0A1I4AET8_9HYPH|nr:anhydro-N-acetylmuramic acid kinase [Methylocapsa palsarum]SFK54700.1 anhydro-N-acetylmuramic acid kinase [Methylocapsa palsarum]
MANLTRTIGLMSGTSMDGVDVALIETDGKEKIELGPFGSFAYGDEDRALLRAALVDAARLDDRIARPGTLAQAEAMVTLRHAEAVERFLAERAIDRKCVDVVGFHGQTVLHRPEQGLTVQIGDGAALAARLGVTVVHDFRAADVAAGGQGAPLVPAFHRALAARAGFAAPVVVINIGGVANLTFIAPGEEPIACDAGPGNALLDDLMLARTGEQMDRDGAAAAAGRVDRAALAALLDNDFFAKAPPKALDRNAFSLAPVERLGLEDAAATLSAFTAAGIESVMAHLPASPTLAIVCGGGAFNKTLMRELADRLPCPLADANSLGWSAEAMEAEAFAYLAARALKNLPLTFPGTTGVREPTYGGVIARP